MLPLLLNRILPGATEAGVEAHLQARFAADPHSAEIVQAGLLLLESRNFAQLDETAQDTVIADLETHPSIALVIALTLEGYYAGQDSPGAQAVGFRVTV